jgi:hypothetical protein
LEFQLISFEPSTKSQKILTYGYFAYLKYLQFGLDGMEDAGEDFLKSVKSVLLLSRTLWCSKMEHQVNENFESFDRIDFKFIVADCYSLIAFKNM